MDDIKFRLERIIIQLAIARGTMEAAIKEIRKSLEELEDALKSKPGEE